MSEERARLQVQEQYKRLVAEWLIDKKITDFLSELLLDYVRNSIKFFSEAGLSFESDESFKLFIKANAPVHIKATLNAIFDNCLETLKPIQVH